MADSGGQVERTADQVGSSTGAALAPAVRQRQSVTAGAALFTVALSLLFGANPTAIKRGLEYVEPLQIGWMRFFLGGLTLLAWALISKRRILPALNEVAPLAVLCTLFVGTIASTNLGQDRTTASHTVVILTAFPIWTAVLSHFFVGGDRMGPPQVVGVALSYAGVLVTFAPSMGGGGAQLVGDALVLLASLLLGASQVLIAVLAQRIELAKIVLAQAFTAVVVLFAASVVVEGTDYHFAWPLVVSLLYQGVLVGGLGFVANGWLLKTYQPSRISVIYSTQPFFGVIAGYYILDEPIGAEVIAGVILVSSGILIVQEVWRVFLRRPGRAT